jgi:hypothetical protein
MKSGPSPRFSDGFRLERRFRGSTSPKAYLLLRSSDNFIITYCLQPESSFIYSETDRDRRSPRFSLYTQTWH